MSNKTKRSRIPIVNKLFLTVSMGAILYGWFIEEVHLQIVWGLLALIIFIDGKFEYLKDSIELQRQIIKMESTDIRSGNPYIRNMGVSQFFMGGLDASCYPKYPKAKKEEFIYNRNS